MSDRLKDPKYWRNRAEQARIKANQIFIVKEKLRMLRVADEYDKLADRAAEQQRISDLIASPPLTPAKW